MTILASTERDSRGGYLWRVLTDYHLHLRPDEVGKASEYFTQENAERYLAAAEEQGIDELGVSEHIYRFKEALELWGHPYWHDQAEDDLAAYCEFVRTTPLRLGVEADYHPRGRRIGSRATRGPRLRLRGRVSPLPRGEGRGRRPALRRLGVVLRRGFALEQVLRVAGGAGPLGSLRHRLPPRPDQDLGRRPAVAGARSALPLRTVRRGAGGVRDRGRGVDGRAAQARRRDLPGPGAGRDVPRGGRRVRPLLGRPRTGPGRVRI